MNESSRVVPNASKRRFLLVTRDEDIQFLWSRLLQARFNSAEIEIVQDADSAETTTKGRVYDGAVIVDSARANGICEVLRACQPDIPIILVYDYGEPPRSSASVALEFGEWMKVAELMATLVGPKPSSDQVSTSV